jgi:hypothetical protein
MFPARRHPARPRPPSPRLVRRWPLFVIASPAMVAIWSGWVSLGEMCGFGLVEPFPASCRGHAGSVFLRLWPIAFITARSADSRVLRSRSGYGLMARVAK